MEGSSNTGWRRFVSWLSQATDKKSHWSAYQRNDFTGLSGHTRRAAVAAYGWFHHSLPNGIAHAKAFAFRMRQRSIGVESTTTEVDTLYDSLVPSLLTNSVLAELATIGRGMPKIVPTDRHMDEWVSRLTKRNAPDPATVREFENFVIRKLRGAVEDDDWVVTQEVPLSDNAGVGWSRKAGGIRAAITKQAVAQRVIAREVEGVDISRGVTIGWLIANVRPQLVEPLVLPEAGGKVRIATIAEPINVTLAGAVNAVLIKVLRNLRPSKGPLSGDARSMADVLGSDRTQDGRLFYSADLSAASDYIEPEFGKAFARVVGRMFTASRRSDGAALTKALEIIVSPGRARLPDGRVIALSRGAHMGIGTTWPLLSLMNMFAAEQNAGKGARRSYLVMGDDLVGRWTRKSVNNYRLNIASVRLVLNDTKSFESTHGAIFAEEVFTTNARKTSNHALGFARASEVFLAKSEGLDRGRGDEGQSVGITLGVIAHKYRRLGAEKERRVRSLMRLTHTKAFKGLPEQWPTQLGGLGFPGKLSAPAKFRKAAATMTRESDRDLSVRLLLLSLPKEENTTGRRVRTEAKRILLALPGAKHRGDQISLRNASKVLQKEAGAVYKRRLRSRVAVSSRSRTGGVLDVVNEARKRWPGAKPVHPKNVLNLLRRLEGETVSRAALEGAIEPLVGYRGRVAVYVGTETL